MGCILLFYYVRHKIFFKYKEKKERVSEDEKKGRKEKKIDYCGFNSAVTPAFRCETFGHKSLRRILC